LANQISAKRIISDARRARKSGAGRHRSLHWGTEYQHAPNAQQLKVAQQLLSAPENRLECRPPMPMSSSRSAGRWQVRRLGMGNLLARQVARIATKGVITRFTFGRNGDR